MPQPDPVIKPAEIRVMISGSTASTGPATEVPVISVTGGEKAIDSASTTGHNYVTELTLVSYITPDNRALSDAANRVAAGSKYERYTITISELAKDKSVVRTFVYENCLLTSFDFPVVSAASEELLRETFTFKPSRMQVQGG